MCNTPLTNKPYIDRISGSRPRPANTLLSLLCVFVLIVEINSLATLFAAASTSRINNGAQHETFGRSVFRRKKDYCCDTAFIL